MDFDLTEEQEAYREQVLRFADRELSADAGGSVDCFRSRWRACADFGIQSLAIPTEYGGSGADAVTTIVAMEALGQGCPDNGLLFSLNAQMWACQYPIARYGTAQQKRRYLSGLCDGSLIAAHAMSEPGSGSDAFALATTVQTRDGSHVLDGSKVFVTNGPVADVFVVFATADRARGFGGLSAFLVPRDTPGLTVGSPARKMGLEGSPMSELFLDGCAVPDDAMLGPAGAGMAIFSAAMQRERSLILATTVGSMERVLRRCLAHARERRQFGQPIGKFQSVASRIVDMKLRLETARLLLYRLGWLIDRGRPVDLDSALVKLHLSEAFVQSSLDAVQVHGGYGYMVEYGVERDVRDAIAGRIYSGTSDIQRNIAARAMGL
jgi:alkylation response protein AidB-like acyl-CoA dehydrogenase